MADDDGRTISGQDSLELLSMLRGGGALYDLAQALHEAAEAVKVHRAKAKITIALTLDMQGAALVVRDEIKSSIPRDRGEPTVVYREASGRFTRRDPRQPSLPIVGDDTRSNVG